MQYAHNMYKHTWFSQEFVQGIVSTKSGSLAGLPLADLLFSVAIARILYKVNTALANSGLESFYYHNEIKYMARGLLF